MSAPVVILEVLLHGERIGTITQIPGDRAVFAFDASYVDNPTRMILSLSFKDRFGELITLHRPTQRRLMPFFSNLLPEGYLRRYLAVRANVSAEREFPLLWALGRDLPGALAVRSAQADSWPVEDEVSHEGMHTARDNAMRFSLAGVQLKFSAIQNARHGLTIPVHGTGGSWIVKLPSAQFARLPENEFSMMELARAIGIEVPATKLVGIDSIDNLPQELSYVEGQAFAIERFDRAENGAVHIEDFAQVFGVYPEAKYKAASYMNILAVLAAETGQTGVIEFIRRLTFNALIGNADMHLKNWSLAYPDRRTAVLAPAYDFVSTTAYIPDERTALTVSRSKRFADYSADELAHLATRARVSGPIVLRAATETVERFREVWRANKSHLPLAKNVVDAIERQLALVPIAQASAS